MRKNNQLYSISKLLSANDVGLTGGHQAGILIPRTGEIINFFPKLDTSIKNPRVELYFEDACGKTWKFSFIYYNGKFFGGTRNEYRLTGMTAYFRENNLTTGDTVILVHNENDTYYIKYARKENANVNENEGMTVKLVLSSGWKIIEY